MYNKISFLLMNKNKLGFKNFHIVFYLFKYKLKV